MWKVFIVELLTETHSHHAQISSFLSQVPIRPYFIGKTSISSPWCEKPYKVTSQKENWRHSCQPIYSWWLIIGYTSYLYIALLKNWIILICQIIFNMLKIIDHPSTNPGRKEHERKSPIILQSKCLSSLCLFLFIFSMPKFYMLLNIIHNFAM